jgi:hypothetical protein
MAVVVADLRGGESQSRDGRSRSCCLTASQSAIRFPQMLSSLT